MTKGDFGKEPAWNHLRLSGSDQNAVKATGAATDPTLAVALDTALNGTSPVVVFRVKDPVLLFPGNAQWGTWRVALENNEWRDLLSHTTFLKVGHHGSHNATPKRLMSTLPNDFMAMLSTRKVKNWPDIPRGPLLDALKRKTRALVRSDQGGTRSGPQFRDHGLYIEAAVPVES